MSARGHRAVPAGDIVAIPVAALIALFAAAAVASAQPASPLGRWKTIDDQTGEAKAIVVIGDSGKGEVEGRIERVFSPPAPSLAPLCDHCSGPLKNQPVIGLRVLWGFVADGRRFVGGRLLDPESGKTYKGTMTVTDGGRKLEVRGFIGFSLLGRTQIWMRE